MADVSKPQAPRGVSDILPPRSELHERIIRSSEDLFRRYGYRRIDTPAFEHAEVFERSLDETSDIVTKEMYTFLDKAGRLMALRPEGTAPVVRAVIEHGLARKAEPVKLYYTAQMFRYERPQAGRRRQHTQVGVEALGSEGPDIDAEVIELAASVYKEVGLKGVILILNSIGHPECRAAYLPKLVEFLESRRSELCRDCQRKISINPLRTFDCKVQRDREVMKDAPVISDYLCNACSEHFDGVQALLKQVGVEYELEPRLVRGLDYYTRTTFEFDARELGAQNSVGAGGRYDGLAEQLGGDRLPGIGFGLGVDRIAQGLEAQGAKVEFGLDAFVVAVGEGGRREALSVATRLRGEGLKVDLDFSNRGVKRQFRSAHRLGARSVIVIGERELAEGHFTVRDMESGSESQRSVEELLAYLKGKM
jgi:histidyl-tRNA synthetase